ncbi:MAG: hypothetical protein HQL82_08800 [Magnetococcales bacterium]|nr:hypothetical protein [Magnetococcales bacterium]
MGGVPATLDPGYFLEIGDYVCVGEGEQFMETFLSRLRHGAPVAEVPGLAYKKDGQLVQNPPYPLVDLNEIALPLIRKERFFVVENGRITSLAQDIGPLKKAKDGGDYEIFPARGCLFKCTFCSDNRLSALFSGWRSIRSLSPENMVREIELARRDVFENFGSVLIDEDDFFARDAGEIARLLALYRERIGLPIRSINANIISITREKLDVVLKSGLLIQMIKIGLQSGSARVNKFIYKRPFRAESFFEFLPVICGHGISVLLDVISENPYESLQDRMDSFRFLATLSRRMAKVPDAGRLLIYHDHKLMFYPGTELYERALRDGHIQQDYVEKVLLTRTTNRGLTVDLEKLFYVLFRNSLNNQVYVRLMELLLASRFVMALLDRILGSRPVNESPVKSL